MLERTFTFWRRLMGRPAGESATALEDDRRLWVRFATHLEGSAQHADAEANERILVTVRDISCGGANLRTSKPFREGEMLTLELPTERGETRTILACVVRAVPEDRHWSLGCVFARELSEDDLGAFGAQKVQARPGDQRVWVRFACEVRASCRKFGDAEEEAQPVRVLNISASGIGLVVPPPLDAGTLLHVDLFDKAGGKVCSILACIVHTTQRADGDYTVGCNFIRQLSDDELESLL
jgi:head-tail adaptor